MPPRWGPQERPAALDTISGWRPRGLAFSRPLAPRIDPLSKARGLGLGLAIARAILEKNQGELRVQIQLGSTFTVRLPLPPEKEVSAP